MKNSIAVIAFLASTTVVLADTNLTDLVGRWVSSPADCNVEYPANIYIDISKEEVEFLGGSCTVKRFLGSIYDPNWTGHDALADVSCSYEEEGGVEDRIFFKWEDNGMTFGIGYDRAAIEPTYWEPKLDLCK